MHQRRGSTYIMVLGTAMIITVVGMASVSIRRVRVRSAGETNSFAAARLLAFSGAEHATVRINADSDWRTTFNGTTVQQTVDGGSFSWRVIDPVDGDLTDDASEAATIVATGTHDDASYTLKLGVTVAGGASIEALSYAIVADADIDVKEDRTVIISGAPLACNDTVGVDEDAVLNADVIADSIDLDDDAVITGTVTPLTESVSMPAAGLFDAYKAMATTISMASLGKGGKMEKGLLSPTSNPWGATNPDGVYYIDTGGEDLEIKKFRVCGTLIIDPGGGKVKVGKGGAVLMQNFRSDYPTLIVNGKLEVEMESGTDLTEAAAETNLNPAGSPYEGGEDSDSSDSYPNEIHGLVHTFDETKLKSESILRGILICEDKVRIEGDVQVIYDPDLYSSPPEGYTDDGVGGGGGGGGGAEIEPGQWERQVN
jgi:hypothetical protein